MPDQRDDLRALAKGGRTNVVGFFVRLIARTPFLIIGGQWYGAEALGRLAYAIIIVEFAAQIATLGLKRGLALHLTGDGKENGAWDGLVVYPGGPVCRYPGDGRISLFDFADFRSH